MQSAIMWLHVWLQPRIYYWHNGKSVTLFLLRVNPPEAQRGFVATAVMYVFKKSSLKPYINISQRKHRQRERQLGLQIWQRH